MTTDTKKCPHGARWATPCKSCRQAELKAIERAAKQGPAIVLLDNLRAGTADYPRHQIKAALQAMGDVPVKPAPSVAEREAGITLEWVYARVKESDGCLVWTGSGAAVGIPQARIKGKCFSMRRVMWELVNERAALSRLKVGNSCGTPMCIHPDHLILRTRSSLLRGRKVTVATKLKMVKLKRSTSKWPQEVIQAIRASDTPARVVAAEHGMHLSYVYYLRNGRMRKDLNSPWAALGGRAA